MDLQTYRNFQSLVGSLDLVTPGAVSGRTYTPVVWFDRAEPEYGGAVRVVTLARAYVDGELSVDRRWVLQSWADEPGIALVQVIGTQLQDSDRSFRPRYRGEAVFADIGAGGSLPSRALYGALHVCVSQWDPPEKIGVSWVRKARVFNLGNPSTRPVQLLWVAGRTEHSCINCTAPILPGIESWRLPSRHRACVDCIPAPLEEVTNE